MFELHLADSELRAPRWDEGTLVLAFAAALVRPGLRPGLQPGKQPGERPRPPLSAGALGQGPGLGHVRGLSIRLHGARLTGDIASAFGRLAAGQWQADGQRPQPTLAVPQAGGQAVQLVLVWANGTVLELQATGFQAVFSGEPDYRESLAC